MNQRPPITISTPDFHRLHALLEHHADSEVANDLLEELDRATLLEPDRLPADVVTMNSRVRFRNEASGQEYTVELVYPHEVEDGPARLSILTPAGAALLGLAVGDHIDWPRAAGETLHLRLIEVLGQAAAQA